MPDYFVIVSPADGPCRVVWHGHDRNDMLDAYEKAFDDPANADCFVTAARRSWGRLRLPDTDAGG